jgi:membrane fusion protein, multidrug efflux system
MAPSDDDKTPPRASAPSPAAPPGHNDRKPPSGRRRRLILIIGIVVLLAALAVGGYYYWLSRSYESTDDAYIEGHPVNISARVAGNIVRVYVADNQHVTPGTPLAAIDPCDYQLRVAAAEAAVQAKRAEVDKAAADVEASRAQWTQQQQDLQRNEMLVKQGAVTEQTLQHSQAATDTALANLRSSEKNLVSTRAQVAQLEVAVEQARLQLSYTQVFAPEAGYVTQKSIEVGAYVSVGQALLILVPD